MLFLRLTAAIFAFHDLLASGQPFLKAVMEGATGLLLCAGLWTPISGAVLAALAIWSAFSANGDPWSQNLLAAVGVALAMLGPGAWSVDARLFGRKRLIREP